MSKLLPCPFCGEEARIERIGDRRQSTLYACNWCSCSLETGEEWDHGKEWNTRAVPDVSELVRYSENNGLTNFTGMQRSSSGDYVRLDQAEAVISAERMKLEATARVGLQLSEKIDSLEADNAELVADYDFMRKSRKKWKERSETLEADNKRLREALDWIGVTAKDRSEKAWSRLEMIADEAQHAALGEVKP